MKTLALVALLLLAACDKKSANAHPDRKAPTCAVQDCMTGQVIDDGCAVVDGKKTCLSCINACPSYH